MPEPDIISALAVLSASGAYAAKKVFGPSLVAMGEALGRLTEYRTRNIGRVVENAASKLPPDHGEGSVSPRVAIHMLEEGSYADDQVVVEYLGGVLASSWSPRGRDDRGIPMAALVSRMSAYALRAHFIFYSEWRRLLAGRSINLGMTEGTAEAHMFVPFRVFFPAMDFSADEDGGALVTHSMHTLSREGLIGEWASGAPELVSRWVPGVSEGGIELRPRMAGAELFMWGMGRGDADPHSFLDPSLDLAPHEVEVTISDGAFIVRDQPDSSSA